MKQAAFIFLMTIVAFAFACSDQDGVAVDATADEEGAVASSTSTTATDDTFYALGYAISKNLGEFHLTESELEGVKRGLEDGVMGREPKIDLEEASARIQQLATERSQKAAATERAEGEEFLAEAARAAGAETTESGLVFQSIEEGSGESPEATDVVLVNYRGTLRDGTEFDSSYGRGQPAQIPLNQVVPCWTEGIQMMKAGGKAKLICPPELAYGDRPNGPIPPGSTLIFEVELLEVMEGNPES